MSVCGRFSSSNVNSIVLVQSHLQHYTEPSADPLPTANGALSNTLLPLGPGTLTHNSAGVPIIVVCTKADLIDEGNDVVAGASGMGSMVKGKGGEWEERTDGVMQVLRTICLKCKYHNWDTELPCLYIFPQMALLYFIQLLYLQRCRSCVSMHCIFFSCPRLRHPEWLLRMKCRLLYAKYSLLHTSPMHWIATELSFPQDGIVGGKLLSSEMGLTRRCGGKLGRGIWKEKRVVKQGQRRLMRILCLIKAGR